MVIMSYLYGIFPLYPKCLQNNTKKDGLDNYLQLRDEEARLS